MPHRVSTISLLNFYSKNPYLIDYWWLAACTPYADESIVLPGYLYAKNRQPNLLKKKMRLSPGEDEC